VSGEAGGSFWAYRSRAEFAPVGCGRLLLSGLVLAARPIAVSDLVAPSVRARRRSTIADVMVVVGVAKAVPESFAWASPAPIAARALAWVPIDLVE